MKILSAKQIKEADQFTIQHEPISSIDLMERAAKGLQKRVTSRFLHSQKFIIFCGMANNGGDGLALTRLLLKKKYQVEAYVVQHTDQGSQDFNVNLSRLESVASQLHFIQSIDDIPNLHLTDIIVDAILGSGLTRPLSGLISDVVNHLNEQPNYVLAIDIPTGLFADDNTENDLGKVLKANLTLTLQQPKLSFLKSNTAHLVGDFKIVDIGLHPQYIKEAFSDFYLIKRTDARTIYKPRNKHTYKGSYGHALLMAGSKGKMGAAMLCAKAAMRSGLGLLTAHIPSIGLHPFQSFLPEAMVAIDPKEEHLSETQELGKYDSIAMGPGIGMDSAIVKVLESLIKGSNSPLILDADALNILSKNKAWLKLLPKWSILTPHPGEFKRLLGVDQLDENYLEKLLNFATDNGVVVVLKNAITAVASPGGHIFFVDEGSPALAKAGSGDVLTGAILGLLSSGYPPLEAAILGVYLHGRAGKLAGEDLSLEAALPTDVINYFGEAFKELNS